MRRSWVRVAGLRLHVRTAGLGRDGVPAVLVHGIGVSSRYLVPTLEAVGGRRPAYAPDLPGFGPSEGPRRGLGVRELADALAAWLDAAGLDRPVLVANSLGCQLVADLLAREPRRACAALLSGPTVDPTARSFLRQVPRWVADAAFERAGMIPVVLCDYLAYGPRRFVDTARSALAHRIEDDLPRIGVPALVVRGGDDRFIRQAWAARCADILPRGRLVVLPGHGHAVVWSAARELAELVDCLVEEGE